jgi:uroporphyrinogen-III synthase
VHLLAVNTLVPAIVSRWRNCRSRSVYNRKQMATLHSKPDKRVLVTRTRRQASELARLIEAFGATPILIPTIEIVPPATYAPLDAALERLESYDWLLFTSANAVEVFHQRRQLLGQQNPDTQSANPFPIPTPKIAVIGPATARAAQGIGLPVDLVPPRYVAESLAEALIPEAAGKRFLLLRAAEARDVLPEALTAASAHVTIADAYRTQIPPASIAELQRLFAQPDALPDAITFTSASTARNLVALLEAAGVTLPASIALISIGPITSQALRDLGLEPAAEAAEPTLPALVEAIEDHWSKK